MKVTLSIIAGICAIAAILSIKITEEIIYDCRLSNFDPNFPPEVKEDCKQLIYEEWRREHNERENGKGIYEDRRGVFRT
jgi:hypothetical protein